MHGSISSFQKNNVTCENMYLRNKKKNYTVKFNIKKNVMLSTVCFFFLPLLQFLFRTCMHIIYQKIVQRKELENVRGKRNGICIPQHFRF